MLTFLKYSLSLCIFLFVNVLSATSYYAFIGGNYNTSNLGFKSDSSSGLTIAGAGGFGQTLSYQKYQLASSQTVSPQIGAGYLYTPLFAKQWFAHNAVEVSVSLNDATFHGTRQEWTSTNYPSTPPGLSNSFPFSIKMQRLNVLADYVLFSKPFLKNFSLFIKSGLGVSSYRYSSVEKGKDTAIIADESFSKQGVNILANLGLGINYHFDEHYSMSVGYDLLFHVLPEEIHPKWDVGTNQPDVTPAMSNAGQNSVTLKTDQVVNQFFVRLGYRF